MEQKISEPLTVPVKDIAAILTDCGVESDHSYMIETKMIDGRKYILVPVDVDTEINGYAVKV